MLRFIKLNAANEPLADDAREFAIIRDSDLKLDWGPTLPTKMNFTDAEAACAAIGMRLPTLAELESIRDITRFKPAVDPVFAADTRTDDWYRASSPDASDPAGCAWVVGFYYGNSDVSGRYYRFWVRPVRASQ